MPRSTTIILLATSMVAVLGAVGVARADTVYEWTDAKGQVHYTDQWVPGAKLITTDSAHHPKTDASPPAQGAQSASSAADTQIKDQQDTRTVQQDEAKARAERCTQEKAEYQRLIQSRRIYTTDKDGNRQYLSDTDAEAARVKARQAMDADCGG